MNYSDRIQLYIQFYYERGVADRIFLRDVSYKELNYPIRTTFTRSAKKQARTKLLPQRNYDPILDEWCWELKEYTPTRWG